MNRPLATVRPSPLTADDLADLPQRCRSCLFWELGRPRPGGHGPPREDELAGDPIMQKQAWCATEAMNEAAPGRIMRRDGEFAGYVLFATPGSFQARRPPIPGASPDALLVATLWVEPQHRRSGIGRLLLQAAIKDALRRGVPALEAYGDRRHRDADCVIPAMFLLHEGFVVHREHPRYPLLRLDVRRTARWTESLEAAWDEVIQRLPKGLGSPSPQPAPRPRAGS